MNGASSVKLVEHGIPKLEILARLQGLIRAGGIYLFLALLLVVSGLSSPTFLKGDNVTNMLQQWAPLGLVVIGQVFVVLVGGLDLSVSSVMATSAVIATALGGKDESTEPIVFLSIIMAVGVGTLNGFLVTKRRVSPFLATFATMVLLQGVRFAYTQGAPSGNVPPWFQMMGNGSALGIPYNVMLLLFLTWIFWLLLHRSVFGRRVYFVGGNATAARLVGFNADLVVIACYVLSAVLASVAGLLLAGYVGIVDNWVGKGFELDSIVACVMGGVALSGGRGGLPGALAGAAILVVVFNIVLLVGLPVQVQIIVKGIVIIVASAAYVTRKSR